MWNPILASDALLPARNQMAFTLGWHIVMACFGMSFPAMIFVVHRRGINGDADALTLARRWSKVASVLFAIGAVSGTILSFEMGLLWPGFMAKFGDVIGLAFSLEGVSFFAEAIFLGIYVYGWDRLPPRMHLMMLAPIMVAGVAGSFLVLSVNSWMNSPTGFDLVFENGDYTVTNVRPLRAIFNSAVGWQFAHMYFAAVMVVGFTVASVYAVGWLRGRRDRLHRLGILVPLTFAAVAAPIQPMIGHFAGQRVADEQPIKLAAMEALPTTRERAPVELGGYWNGEELEGAITVPVDGLLSFIAQNDFDATVIGLDAVDPADRPPVGIVHFAFDTMVALGTALALLAAWYGWRWWRRDDTRGDDAPGDDALGDDVFESKWFVRAIAVSGVAAIAAMELGWVTTEVGRQPWIVHQVMRTEEAVTDAGYIWVTFIGVVVLYAALSAGAAMVIRNMSARWRAGEHHIPSPYGPAELSSRTLDIETPGATDGGSEHDDKDMDMDTDTDTDLDKGMDKDVRV